MRSNDCPVEGVEGLLELFLWTGNRVIGLGDRRIERELGVLVGGRGCGRTDRLGVEGRRTLLVPEERLGVEGRIILFDPEERLLPDGGLTRTVGLVFLRTGVLTEG